MPRPVQQKPSPPWCQQNCEYRAGAGFARPDAPSKVSTARVAFVLEAPGGWEAFYSLPVVGPTGRLLFREMVEPLGYTRADVLLDNAVRCRPPGNVFPTGAGRAAAVSRCRRWDVVLDQWKPDLLGITYHPASLFREKQTFLLVEKAIERAFYWHTQGYRPVLLMGRQAKEIFAPWLAGPEKHWTNHWWPIEWKPQGDPAALVDIQEMGANAPVWEDYQ